MDLSLWSALKLTVSRMVRLDSVVARFTAWADHLFSLRWVFALTAGASLIAGLVVGTRSPRILQVRLGTVAVAAFTFFWALFLLCAWFHPTLGALGVRAKLGRSAFLTALTPERAAIFLILFVLIGAVVVPALTLSLTDAADNSWMGP